MCIALLSTAHPDYALVLINNRDEYLHRPTAPASWWSPPNAHVLGGRDLLRPEHGTWLGITAQGRIAVLTNFREEGPMVFEARSRGALVNSFLGQPPASVETTEEFVKRLVDDDGFNGVGGCSLVCGNAGGRLAVVSNRTRSVEGLSWIVESRGETTGLSNAAFGNRSWEKVLQGEKLMAAAIAKSVARKDHAREFVEELMAVLSVDTLPKRDKGRGWDDYTAELRNTIFVPVVGGHGMDGIDADEIAAATSSSLVDEEMDSSKTASVPQHDGLSGVYGTQTQTVVLIDHKGFVTFVERRLYDSDARPIPTANRDRVFEFQIET
ncbi:hypothetical protein MMC07_006084 [Pseudocyphellaria aurata]|nr:hypothetical protein [Pseudocyphellaria aurata]